MTSKATTRVANVIVIVLCGPTCGPISEYDIINYCVVATKLLLNFAARLTGISGVEAVIKNCIVGNCNADARCPRCIIDAGQLDPLSTIVEYKVEGKQRLVGVNRRPSTPSVPGIGYNSVAICRGAGSTAGHMIIIGEIPHGDGLEIRAL